MREGEVRGEIQLFRAIIDRAVKDAFSTRGYSSAITKLDKKQAQFFLCDDKKWFRECCECAGVSADRIRKVSRALRQMPEAQSVKYYRDLLRNAR